ncbi:LysR family transcriptional regulator [Ramlibacter sp.]|uniref:LysR family transcriptional regulator n=1 Tax=Ramlibacter sp. TaxID=1917967 RepID=UPI003D0F181F
MSKRIASPDTNLLRRSVNLVGRVDFVTFKLFLAIVEEQSIAKAAEREAIAPSAVSKRVADLESALCVQLLERRRTGIRPTEAGEAVVRYARSILRDLSRLEGELGDHAAGMRGIVRIAAAETALVSYLPRVLESFNAKNPTIRVDLRTMVSSRIVQAVLDGDVDVGIFWGTAPADETQVMHCFVDHLMVVVPQGHPLSELTSVRFVDVLDYELIQQESNSTVQALLERSAASLGRPLRTRVQVNTYDAAFNMAQAGFGVAIVPDTYTGKVAANSGMAILRLNEPWAARRYDLCAAPMGRIGAQAQALVEHFRSEGAGVKAS